MKRTSVLAFAIPLLLVACKQPTPPVGTDTTPPSSVGTSVASKSTSLPVGKPKPSTVVPGAKPGVPSAPSYVAYTEDALGNGKISVLFFHASWCPICKAADTKLRSWYQKGGIPITTYIVNYDEEVNLKRRYGVTYQHTFVKIDGEGNVIDKVQDPNDAELKELLQL